MKAIYLCVAALLCGALPLIAQESNLPKQIKVGAEREKMRREFRLPMIDGYRLLKCDFHIHTIFSDGIVWPTLRVDEAWEEGLDAIALTDHIEGQPARPHIVKGDHNDAYNTAKEEAARRDIILIKGGEITRSMPPGHLNALFLKDANEIDQKDVMKAIEAAHNQGAFIQWNHPGWGVDTIRWYDMHEELYKKGWINGIEIFNEFEWYPVALNWAIDKKLTILGNTDVHDVIERLYDFKTMSHRPMTLVLSRERTAEGIREALFAGRTLVYFYDRLVGKEDLLRKLFDASVEVKPAHATQEGQRFVQLVNSSDMPFHLLKSDTAKGGFPATIQVPARGTVVVALPMNDTSSVRYEVSNLIITPEKNLGVTLF